MAFPFVFSELCVTLLESGAGIRTRIKEMCEGAFTHQKKPSELSALRDIDLVALYDRVAEDHLKVKGRLSKQDAKTSLLEFGTNTLQLALSIHSLKYFIEYKEGVEGEYQRLFHECDTFRKHHDLFSAVIREFSGADSAFAQAVLTKIIDVDAHSRLWQVEGPVPKFSAEMLEHEVQQFVTQVRDPRAQQNFREHGAEADYLVHLLNKGYESAVRYFIASNVL